MALNPLNSSNSEQLALKWLNNPYKTGADEPTVLLLRVGADRRFDGDTDKSSPLHKFAEQLRLQSS